MIKAYSVAEAGTVQPFAYFQLVFVTIIALTVFDERPDAWTVAGRGADPRRRPLHHPARGPARAGALEGRWLGSLCGEPRFELAG